MWYVRENKSKWIKENYIPDWEKDIKIEPFSPEKIPWINEPTINSTISIES